MADDDAGPDGGTPAPPAGTSRSRAGLNGLNFFAAAVQTGFGPFILVWLTQQGWSLTDIGFALSLGTGVQLVGQIPGGLLVDNVHHKRGVTATALVALACSALFLAAYPTQATVWTAEVLHALATCVITPAIASITLSLCGHAGFSQRLGVNTSFGGLGNALAATAMGPIAYYASERGVFVLTALLVIPGLLALFAIRNADRLPPDGDHHALRHPRERRERPWCIFYEPSLHVFAVCLVLFQFANAAMLPLALHAFTLRVGDPGLLVSATIIAPQFIMAALSPWAGQLAQQRGRRPVLLLGLAVLPLRAVLFATAPAGIPLVMIEALDGVSAAVFGLMLPLIAADLTKNSGHLNLAIASLSLASGLGGTFSNLVAGWVADQLGLDAAFGLLALAAGSAIALVYLAMPETRPDDSPQPGLATVAP